MHNKILEYSDEIITEAQKASIMLNYVLEREDNSPEVYVPLDYVKNSLDKIDKNSWNIQDTIAKEIL